MTQQGIMFDTQGPVMSGTWYNPKTGDSFTVRDSFFEDNQFVVTTTDGRILNYNQIQNYVQSEKPINQNNQNNQSIQNNSLPPEVAGILANDNQNDFDMLAEDQMLINKSLNSNIIAQPIFHEPQPQPQPQTSNYNIIDRALTKQELPELNVSVNWKIAPEKEIQLLTEIMDVSLDEIVEWYISKFDMVTIKQNVQNSLKNLLYNKYGNSEPVETEVVPREKTTKKKKS